MVRDWHRNTVIVCELRPRTQGHHLEDLNESDGGTYRLHNSKITAQQKSEAPRAQYRRVAIDRNKRLEAHLITRVYEIRSG